MTSSVPANPPRGADSGPIKASHDAPAVGTTTTTPAPTAADVARAVRRARARSMLFALLLWVGFPTLLGAIYYGAIAPSEYESNSTLIMLGEDASASQGLIMAREFMMSRDMLAALDQRARFSEHYQRGGDFLTRLSSHAGSESRYDSFAKHVAIQVDAHSHVLRVRVRAYSSERARLFAQTLLTTSSEFITRVAPARTSLVVLSQPSAPSEATHPRRAYGLLTVFLVNLALFGIGSLLVAAVREHAQF